MKPLRADTPLTALDGVGPKRASALAAAGYRRAADLLLHLPRSYEDRRNRRPIADTQPGKQVALRGRLRGARRIFVRRRGLRLVRATLEDSTASVPVVWFNQPYLDPQTLNDTEVLLHGELKQRRGGLELVNPSIEKVADKRETAGIVPLYRPVEGLGSKLMGVLVRQVLERLDLECEVEETLRPEMLEAYGLPRLPDALREIHQPANNVAEEDLRSGQIPAHARLIYGELLDLRLRLERRRRQRREQPKGHEYRVTSASREEWESSLPFELTAAQARAWGEILRDLENDRPMQRLLQGDVGSGKTAVALLALRAALDSGLQGAFMAPTELLAEQHYAFLRRVIPGRYRIGLYTSSSPDNADALRSGKVHLAVGTHALLEESVRFRALGLGVVDEQQRFGVEQRRGLTTKANAPDLLVMTATPIPRSLALTVYGDLDLSIIDELPPGRQPVHTSLLPKDRRPDLYRALERRLHEGGQAFIVLPFIEASEAVDGASLEVEGAEIEGWLGAHPHARLHGRLAREERESIMARFLSGELKVLLATTVIEVGVDVPQASTMIIESAERFGLAQLHQLRGRVGRGGEAAYCVAVYGDCTEEAKSRLAALAATSDGFEIAERDLEIRGPGDLLGKRQSGMPMLQMADLRRDVVWLDRACRDAREILAREGLGGRRRAPDEAPKPFDEG